MNPERPLHIGIAVLAVAITTVFFIDLCNAIYLCGCDHLWAGADARCNIHQVHAKHCPWCAMPLAGVTAVYFGIVIPQVLVAFRPSRWPWWKRCGLAVLLFPLIGGAQALVMGAFAGYWD
jgi:hypothetical protein